MDLARETGQSAERRARSSRRAAVLAAVAAGFVAWPDPTEGKRKRRPKKPVTKSFRSFDIIDMDTDSNEADPYPSALLVSGFGNARIVRVVVTVTGLSTPTASLVSLLLVAPDGRAVELMWKNGVGHAANNVELTFDDRAATPLPFNDPIVDGTYRPDRNGSYIHSPPAPPQPYDGALSAFAGGSPDGLWRLFVVENMVDGGGRINAGWTLTITAQRR